MGQKVAWRTAMATALYGEAGFFTRPGLRSAAFRTSANAHPVFAAAMLRLVLAVDDALGRPDPLTVIDVGAGAGNLLAWLGDNSPLGQRLRLSAVELAPRPHGLFTAIDWSDRLPDPGTVTGVLLATEWLDNVPLDVAEVDATATARYVLVDPESGAEAAGAALNKADADWARRWWPSATPGTRVELGGPRDAAWSAAVACLDSGICLAVDYGHTRSERPAFGTLTGFAAGRQTAAVPDGSSDVTAHVAMDSVAAAGEAVAGLPALLTTQRDALRGLGVGGTRPPRELAERDPTAYVRALADASSAAELTDTAGLGGHYWLVQPVRCAFALLGEIFTGGDGVAR
jgi:SAM-dependent MidA family methyltransferase